MIFSTGYLQYTSIYIERHIYTIRLGSGMEHAIESIIRSRDASATLKAFQREAIKIIEKTDDNLVVIAPTGAGKTLIGVAALLKHGKGFYLAPTRALMLEKYLELRSIFPDKKVVLTNKDYSIPRHVLKNAHIRVLSPYKMLLYLSTFTPDDGVVVVDELHEIRTNPDFEAVISALKQDGYRIIGLSATINDEDSIKVSRWLNAHIVKSTEERPVPLQFLEIRLYVWGKQLIVDKGAGILEERARYADKTLAVADAVASILRKDPDAGILVWCPTRSDADLYARAIATKLNQGRLPLAVETVANRHDEALAQTLPRGVGIHHGGISQKNRELVEELFRKKEIKVLVSCFTLSHGVNLPIKYLIMTGLYNYDGEFLDATTFHQITGRAGRPGLTDIGIVVVFTVGNLESFTLSKLIATRADAITSKLHSEWTLTKIVAQRLAATRSLDKIRDFIDNTYFVVERGQGAHEEIKATLEKVTTNIVSAYYDIENGSLVPKGRAEYYASLLGLHPDEFNVAKIAVKGEYRPTVSLAVETAGRVLDVGDDDDKETVISHGLLAGYFASRVARDLADLTQAILDGAALHARVVYGYKSPEFAAAMRIAEQFTYGGNPKVEKLTRVLRHDELKRLCRNMTSFFITSGFNIEKDIASAVEIVFGAYKTIHYQRVLKVVDALLEYKLDSVSEEARAKAYSAAKKAVADIAAKTKAKVLY